ncbi:AraC family transcriptional regulator [Paraliobacillus zengyii]|uniref:AraC family transcriptional regulator n=1 Tax=Paraliobacillus zengyii TaxID=2213194 RepID=UPI000DD3CD33|nr:AraC family transcriptional regulator [Paraliobacillus zengyii]
MADPFIYQTITPNKELPFRLLLHNTGEKRTVIKHWHKSLEVSYTVCGKIEDYYINGNHYTTKPGDILIVNPYCIHGIQLEDQPERVSLTLMIPIEFLNTFSIDIEDFRFQNTIELDMTETQKEHYHKMQQSFQELYECSKNEFSNPIRLKAISLVFNILYILTYYFYETNEPASFIGKRHFTYLEEITSYIESNHDQNLSLANISDTFHLSKGYLSKIFKKYMGETIPQYILQVRLQKAYQLLLNTDDTVEMITEMVGFPNKKAFSKAFKEVYGDTPLQYRIKYHSKVSME